MKKSFILFTGIWAALVGGLTGCASGGFKMTREYAGFVNKQNVILRVILYILTGIVFAVTLILDFVIFNTMDFWNGRVAQGTYNFQDGEKKYIVEHKLKTDGLKESTISIQVTATEPGKVIVLREQSDKTIQVLVDGKLMAQVDDIHFLPKISYFDPSGRQSHTEIIPLESVQLATR